MRIFVTGASGWIGSAVVQELLAAGHQVAGLARSDAATARIEAAGATAVRGDLDDPECLANAAADSDGVVHLAFQHEIAWSGNFAAAGEADRRAVEAMGAALAGTERPFVLASGVIGLAIGRTATESDGLIPDAMTRANPAGVRAATALLALSLRGVGIRSSIVRYAPTVHGDGDHGFISALITIAREHGAAGYVDDGANRWPAVHRSDAARVTRRAVESAPGGSVIHAVGEDGIAYRQIAEAISRHLGIPTISIPRDQAVEHFGFLGHFVGIDTPTSSAITRDLLNWEPTGPGLIADLDEGHYFSSER
jgi:nucleoside-diphosphate-sugar epimerase